MSRTVNVNRLLVLLSILVGTSIGGWLGGFLGGFRGCICFPSRAAAALQVIARELWLATEWQQPADGGGPTGPERPVGDKQASQGREPDDEEQNTGEDELKAPACSAAAQRTRID